MDLFEEDIQAAEAAYPYTYEQLKEARATINHITHKQSIRDVGTIFDIVFDLDNRVTATWANLIKITEVWEELGPDPPTTYYRHKDLYQFLIQLEVDLRILESDTTRMTGLTESITKNIKGAGLDDAWGVVVSRVTKTARLAHIKKDFMAGQARIYSMRLTTKDLLEMHVQGTRWHKERGHIVK